MSSRIDQNFRAYCKGSNKETLTFSICAVGFLCVLDLVSHSNLISSPSWSIGYPFETWLGNCQKFGDDVGQQFGALCSLDVIISFLWTRYKCEIHGISYVCRNVQEHRWVTCSAAPIIETSYSKEATDNPLLYVLTWISCFSCCVVAVFSSYADEQFCFGYRNFTTRKIWKQPCFEGSIFEFLLV